MADLHNASEVTRWLLQPEDPSIRLLALRYLLDLPEDDPQVRAVKAAIPSSPVVSKIFSRQAVEGYWGDREFPYRTKYKGTYWTLMVLGHLGLGAEDERIRKAVEHVFHFQQPSGGFAERGVEGARLEYISVMARRKERGQARAEESLFVPDLIHQMTLSCLTGNVVAALSRLGFGDDPRLWRAVEWLVSVQNADGGWLCPYWKPHVRDRHSCFYGTICALEALAEIPPEKRAPGLQHAADRGAEFLLMHHLYRADHHGLRTINPAWLQLAFPWFYSYNILRGLWVLAKLGCRDDRMADALKVLQQKRGSDGRWNLEITATRRMQAELEKQGEPSKWITFYASWVLARLKGGISDDNQGSSR